MKKKLFFVLCLVLVSLTGLFLYGLFWASNPQEIPTPLLNKQAPNFVFQDWKTNLNTPLAANIGTPVLINFWASWCVPCIEEAVLLENWYQQQKQAAQPISLLAIAVLDTSEDVQQFIEKWQITYPIMVEGSDSSISLDYGVTGVPETFFLDENGKVLKKINGAVQQKDLSWYQSTWQ